jgi:type II secretory pathway pseudopilin PulG
MTVSRRAPERGMTLIEILLALIVMVLGVTGILAMFPPALQSGRESMEETNAAILGESVAQALTNALRFAQPQGGGGGAGGAPASTNWEVTLSHDLKVGGTTVKYKFLLPSLVPPGDPTGGLKHFPSSTNPAAGSADPGGNLKPIIEDDDRIFRLAGDQWVKATTQNVMDNFDPTDAYSQFAFSFDCRKVNTLEYLINPSPKPDPNDPNGGAYTLTKLESMCRLYEFRIHIFRAASQAGSFSGGGTGTMAAGADTRTLIATIVKQIAME